MGFALCAGSTLIEYLGDRDLDDVGTTVSWACSDCKAIGRSLYVCLYKLVISIDFI